jgi:hypothetical protein
VTTLSAGQRRAAYIAALHDVAALRPSSLPSSLLPVALLLAALIGPLAYANRRSLPRRRNRDA